MNRINSTPVELSATFENSLVLFALRDADAPNADTIVCASNGSHPNGDKCPVAAH